MYFLLKFISFFIKKKFIFKIRKVHFPFTIISIELDIYYNKNWLELLGFGLINNNIFINNKIYIKGIAGGVGVDRLFMICYKLKYIKEVYD
ncbi:putative phenylalanyl-tRNA synthetase alpha subunit [Candidatus Carsonella ruddii CE isolate Thao2000]|uniref:Putative phenylalanyl-tRNA synthetase alpha subunit n=1 Tax=Candidatus Carsonella ruddii CE isolate Thao2000 TaxID=1202536 RepID=J7GSV9_CARRU|nr:putative phenylalanyl-tRNA synthetase alpha subunit [Candidatus Carsonella ruddii CE isolate Thao2000]